MILCGDNIDELKKMAPDSVSSIVTDAPYGLGKEPNAEEMLRAWLDHGYLEVKGGGFMGKEWDAFVPQPLFWKEAFRVLKPGGHVLCFFGTRTYDWGVMAIRLAGFEIRDCIQWVYGSGFPKSHNISKAIDKMHAIEKEVIEEQKQMDGLGTALKPANEPIVLARKPLEKGLSIAENILKWGTGGLNIDACRIPGKSWKWGTQMDIKGGNYNTNKPSDGHVYAKNIESNPQGRWPANFIHDGSEEVEKLFPTTKSGVMNGKQGGFGNSNLVFGANSQTPEAISYGDKGSAARFFYVAKASQTERNWGLDKGKTALKHNSTMRDIEDTDWKEVNANHHPTVKPVKLMRYLVRLVTPRGGVCLDPFGGSGSTGIACKLEGFDFIIIDNDEESCKIAVARIENWTDDLETMIDLERKHETKESKEANEDTSQLDLEL